jgi:hypothetical protein
MTVRYHARKSGIFPSYLCQKDGIKRGGRICQRIPGATIDKAVGELLLNTLTPMALEVALTVQQEISSRLEEADRLRAKQVERAEYEVELARQRYMQVDPNNRLVADALEAEWNENLRALKKAQEEYERQRKADRILVDQETRRRIMHLASDVPKLWNDPGTSDRDRKRIIRLLLEDVTLIRQKQIIVHVRFKGGTTTTITLPGPKRVWENWKTPEELIVQIDFLLNDYTDSQIAEVLNERGQLSGKGKTFHSGIIGHIRRRYGLKSRYDRLRENGMIKPEEMAERLGLRPRTIKLQHRYGLLRGHVYNDKNECLFEPPNPDTYKKNLGQKIVESGQFTQDNPDHVKEGQYEA